MLLPGAIDLPSVGLGWKEGQRVSRAAAPKPGPPFLERVSGQANKCPLTAAGANCPASFQNGDSGLEWWGHRPSSSPHRCAITHTRAHAGTRVTKNLSRGPSGRSMRGAGLPPPCHPSSPPTSRSSRDQQPLTRLGKVSCLRNVRKALFSWDKKARSEMQLLPLKGVAAPNATAFASKIQDVGKKRLQSKCVFSAPAALSSLRY